MRAVLDIDLENRAVTVQPGVTNRAVTEAVEQSGFYYAPDPSSQIACSIGGNIAENSGGVHCLKYGTTTNNLPRESRVTRGRDPEALRRSGGRVERGARGWH